MDDHRAFYSSAPSITASGSDARPSQAAGAPRQTSGDDRKINVVKREEPESFDRSAPVSNAAIAGGSSSGGAQSVPDGEQEEEEEKLMHQLQRTASIPLAKTPSQSRSSTGDAADRDIADGQCHAIMREESDHRLERSCTRPPIEGGFYCIEREPVLVLSCPGSDRRG